MKMKIKVLAAFLLSSCTLFSAQTQADQKFGFAKKCSLPDAPMPIKFKVHDYLSNFDGIAFNIIYIPADESERGDLYSLYTNSDGFNYLSQKPSTRRGITSDVISHVNNPAGTMGSYLSKPVCTTKEECQTYPVDWNPSLNHGLSGYQHLQSEFPNDFIYVHSGMFPTLSDDTIDTTIFTMTRNFKLLRVEIFSVTNIGDPHVDPDWMQTIGAEPIVFEYRRPTYGTFDYYVGSGYNRISRPMSGSMTEFPAHLDKNIQSMDFFIKFDKGYLGEIYSSAKFYYFSEKQKEILATCN
ncbi:hypothetical protein M8S10_16530 [Enterobacter chuandaensis]|uniref:hypothetical protein n=1 Tax=Enterobacter chuandaensis TaxID=2497875 RepID=UPI00207550AB|nr:hypothetical protein [Enterobacter chuandaensis]MCM7590410.1 hypothetical protein [Enterobacter chuandaensis]